MSELLRKSCVPCEGSVPALTTSATQTLLLQVPNWSLTDTETAIVRIFNFNNFYETMAFVNAVAYIAHQEDHHPDLTVEYRRCVIRYQTHAIKGLSENDFICAAKIDQLVT